MLPVCLLLLAATLVHADEPADDPEPRRSAVLFDPTAPVIAGVATALGVPALDLNLRGHHMRGDRWGITAELEWVSVTQSYTLKARHVGLRAGPRWALRGRGLDDWALLPFAIVGRTSFRAGGIGSMGDYWVLGSGAELGRVWIWGPVAFELGLGLYLATSQGYTVRSAALEGTELDPGPSLRPLLDLGVGYAW